MDERPRHREILGATTTQCPNCGGGPMVIIRSQRVRRLRDLLNPRFDADVLHREACTACDARFPVGGERLRALLAEGARQASPPAPGSPDPNAPPPSTVSPQPRPQPGPEPGSEPEARPDPARRGEPETVPVLAPVADPGPEPEPVPDPRREPVPEPDPVPEPEPVPEPPEPVAGPVDVAASVARRRTRLGAGRRTGPVRGTSVSRQG